MRQFIQAGQGIGRLRDTRRGLRRRGHHTTVRGLAVRRVCCGRGTSSSVATTWCLRRATHYACASCECRSGFMCGCGPGASLRASVSSSCCCCFRNYTPPPTKKTGQLVHGCACSCLRCALGGWCCRCAGWRLRQRYAPRTLCRCAGWRLRQRQARRTLCRRSGRTNECINATASTRHGSSSSSSSRSHKSNGRSGDRVSGCCASSSARRRPTITWPGRPQRRRAWQSRCSCGSSG